MPNYAVKQSTHVPKHGVTTPTSCQQLTSQATVVPVQRHRCSRHRFFVHEPANVSRIPHASDGCVSTRLLFEVRHEGAGVPWLEAQPNIDRRRQVTPSQMESVRQRCGTQQSGRADDTDCYANTFADLLALVDLCQQDSTKERLWKNFPEAASNKAVGVVLLSCVSSQYGGPSPTAATTLNELQPAVGP
jgi:hypothetical protein